LIRDWILREQRSRQEWSKDEGSVKSNVAFGKHGLRDLMPGGVKLEGFVPGVSRLENYNVAHLYDSAPSDPKNLSETENLFFGLHFLALHEPGREGAIEIESMTGKRTLMVLGRDASRPLASSVSDGLHVVDLATSDDIPTSKKTFYAEVRKSLATASQRIQVGSVNTVKGDHCDWCDYGELCRRSRGFGEDESSVGEDLEPEDE